MIKILQTCKVDTHLSNGQFEICKLIIDNVDNTNPAANNGRTPLQIAKENGYFGAFKLIFYCICKYTKKMFK